MRLEMLWSVTALLVLVAVFEPVGQKSVEEFSCSGDWRSGRTCDQDGWTVGYRLLSMETHHVHTPDDGEREEKQWAYPYTSEAPHDEGITPLLLAGAAAIPAALLTLATGIWHGIAPSVLARRLHMGAWAVLAASLALFLLGMAIHSGTWVARRADWWRPGVGILALGSLASGWQLLPKRERFGMPSLPPGSGA